MRLRGTILLILVVCISFALPASGNILVLDYDLAQNDVEQGIKDQLQQTKVVENVVEFINEHFILSESLYLNIGHEDDASYYPEDNTIYISYAFIQEIKERFIADDYQESGISIFDATMDGLTHTLFHELAHALIYNYELPIVGREEDAADSLASFLLIEYFDEGADMLISAANLFALESEDNERFSEQDFWDEHSLDIQRYYSALCHVYGSDPDKYGYLIKELEFSADRAERCIEEYDMLIQSWNMLLRPVARNN